MCNMKQETSPEKIKQMKSVERWEKLIVNKLGTSNKVINQIIDCVKYPVITEKTYGGLIKKRQFTFDIDKRLTKPQIKSLFEKLFEVNVQSVNTLIPPRKKLRVGIAQGFRPLYKRAIITLKENQSLNFLMLNSSAAYLAAKAEKAAKLIEANLAAKPAAAEPPTGEALAAGSPAN